MKILSHRGYWRGTRDKNSLNAFARSFQFGFGTETDLRDLDGELVISHDPPRSGAILARVFFDLYSSVDSSLPLALNIKSDGLQVWVSQAIERYELKNAFVFDMSVPDARGYLKAGVSVFTRQSELERDPSFYDVANGVWLDGFDSDWVTKDDIEKHLNAGKQVCIVSSELHGRPHAPLWERLLDYACVSEPSVMLCTDFPQEASEFLSRLQ